MSPTMDELGAFGRHDESVTDTRHASERMETARPGVTSLERGRSVVCPVCGALRDKNKKWTKYCTDKCRKKAWAIRNGEQGSPSIVERLNRIEAQLAEIRRMLESR